MRTKLIKPNNVHTLDKEYPSTIEEISDKEMKLVGGHHSETTGSQFILYEQGKIDNSSKPRYEGQKEVSLEAQAQNPSS